MTAEEEYRKWRSDAANASGAHESEYQRQRSPGYAAHGRSPGVYVLIGFVGLVVLLAAYRLIVPYVPPPEPKTAPEATTAPAQTPTAEEQHAQWCQMTLAQRHSFGYSLPCPGDAAASNSRSIIIVVPGDSGN